MAEHNQSGDQPERQPSSGVPLHLPGWLDWWLEVGPKAGWRTLALYAVALVILTGIFVGLRALTPASDYVGTHQQLGLPPCSFRAVLGLPCPGCGGTTAVSNIAHLRPLEAAKSSLFGAAVGVAMVLGWLMCAASLVLRRPIALRLEGTAGARVMGYTVALMLLSWVIKILYTLLVLPGIPE